MTVNSAAVLGGITPASGERFTLVIDPDTALEEIVYAVSPTSPSSTTITIIRGVDGTGTEGVSGVAHSAGAKVRHMAIGVDFREANNHIKNETTAHGLTIANVLETTDTNMITTAMLQSNAVTTAKITDANVTTAKIADSAITSAKIADLTIATGDIADSAITTAKIANANVTTAKIEESAVTNSRIAADAVTADKIAADAVGTSEIANLAVTTAKVADSAITSAKIADGTIVAGDIADGTITSAKIADGTIVAGDLADGAVTSAKILDGTIVNADVSATAAIAYTKLSLGGTITSADLVDGTIVATDIADGTITAAKMVSDPYARANHTGTQTASTVSDFDTQVRTSRLDQMAAPTGPVSVNSQKITSLGTPTSNADAATKLYVDTKVADLVNSAPSTLDTLGEIATAIQAGGTVYDSFVLKAGSTMTGNLTLAGAPTQNLHAATKLYVDDVAGSATAAAASAAAAATTYDNFDDRYLGSKSSAPSVDNDGNTLLVGAIYWNSTTNQMFAWSGSAWASISSSADIYRYRYTASGGETSESGPDDNGLTLSYIPGKEQVYLNGVLLARTSDYTATNGSSITSLAALTAGDILEVITFTAFEVADAIARSVFDAKGDILVGTSNDTPGKLALGTDGHYLQADSSTATGVKWASVSGYSAPTLGSTSIASGATVSNVNGLTINSTTIPTSKTLVDTDSSQTLTNKTIDTASNTITGAVTLTGTQTLTNKTLTDPKINLAFDAETASYTAVLANNGQVVTMDNSSANTFSIPTNASVAFPIGTQLNIIQIGTGQTTIQAVTSGTTSILSTGAAPAAPKLRVRYSMATCIKAGTDLWYVTGDIA